MLIKAMALHQKKGRKLNNYGQIGFLDSSGEYFVKCHPLENRQLAAELCLLQKHFFVFNTLKTLISDST